MTEETRGNLMAGEILDADKMPVTFEDFLVLDKVLPALGNDADEQAIKADDDWEADWPESPAMRTIATEKIVKAERQLAVALAEYAAEAKKFRNKIREANHGW